MYFTERIYCESIMKKIKFNLKLDENSVRNIEDLRDNFEVYEIIQYFRDGKLETWLKLNSYTEYLSHVENISKSKTDKETFKELAKIFEVEVDEDILDALLVKNDGILVENEEFIIKRYFEKYESLINSLTKITESNEHKELKNSVKKLIKYIPVLDKDSEKVFLNIFKKNPTAIIYIYNLKEMRRYFQSERWGDRLKDLFSNKSLKNKNIDQSQLNNHQYFKSESNNSKK